MKAKKKSAKLVKNTIKNIFYFVICLLFMLNCLHFTQKMQPLKAQGIAIEIKQVKNQKIYQNLRKDEPVENNKTENYPEITFELDGKIYKPDNNVELSQRQKQFIKNGFYSRVKTMNFAYKNGFSEKQSVCYCFPEIEKIVNVMCENKNKEPLNAEIKIIKNSAKTTIKEHQNGIKVNEISLFSEIFNVFNKFKQSYSFIVPTEEVLPNITTELVKNMNYKRAEFTTNFKNSSEARKNNIKTALKNFDGKVLLPGEILSFNKTTGYRTPKNGYEKAKIIKNGMFVEEFGGGVCQVSSTIYNACLLSDLEIVESHSHSLPVSYVSPGFDAMVNIGSSDLQIKNTLECPIIFATSSENDECKVCIYGTQKTARIVRKYNKINENLHFETIYTADNELYNLPEVDKDKEIIINQGKPGKTIESWLEYYENDVLIKTKKLRTNIYSPTKRVVLVSKEDILKFNS